MQRVRISSKAESTRREVYLGSEEGKGAPFAACCLNIPTYPPPLCSEYRYAWQVQVWALHCCRQWDQRLCQRRWSTANMQLSDPITFSGRARLRHPRRAPPVLQKKFSQALKCSASLQTHAALCMFLCSTCGLDSEKPRVWIWSVSWVGLC